MQVSSEVIKVCRTAVQLPTAEVVGEPLLWLRTMAEHGVTHSWAPNFGFKLVARAIEKAVLMDHAHRQSRARWNAAGRGVRGSRLVSTLVGEPPSRGASGTNRELGAASRVHSRRPPRQPELPGEAAAAVGAVPRVQRQGPFMLLVSCKAALISIEGH